MVKVNLWHLCMNNLRSSIFKFFDHQFYYFWTVHFFFDILFAQLGLDSEDRRMITGTKTELKGRYEGIMSGRYVYLKLF